MKIFKKKKHVLSNQKYPERHTLTRANSVWISSNGRKTRLSDMDDNHLKNAYAKMLRHEFSEPKTEHWEEILKNELIYRAHEKHRD